MSWPATIFTCNRCGFKQGTVHTWGKREYLLPDGARVDVPRCISWCHGCGGIASVENLSADDKKRELTEAREELANLGFWSVRKRKWLRNKIADLEDVLALLGNRVSLARCLYCGSTSIETPRVPGASGNSEFIHPGCGGVLEAKMSDIRIAIRQTVTRYTPEGTQVERVYVDGYSAPRLCYYKELEEENARIRAAR
jgi:hypothetical protein